MKIRPINGQVLVKPLEEPETTRGGIHLPDSARKKSLEGEVAAVAKDATEEVAVGDRVLYKEFAGTEITVEGSKYILLSSDDLLLKHVEADAIPD